MPVKNPPTMRNNTLEYSGSYRSLLHYLILILILDVALSNSQIFYLQEAKIDSEVALDSGIAQMITMQELCPTCANTTLYGFTLWVNKYGWDSVWNPLFRASNTPEQDGYEGRVMMSAVMSNDTTLFWIGNSTETDGYQWTGWSLPDSNSSLTENQWIFISYFTNQTGKTEIGGRYYLNQSSNSVQWILPGSPHITNYQLSSTATIYWASQDPFLGSCYCYMQYVRLYLNYIADSQDTLINLALMYPESSLYLFAFASDPLTNNNQTFIVNNITNISQSDTIGFKGYSMTQSSQAPQLGPYNSLMCRPGQIASFPLNRTISKKGLVVGMDFYPYPGGLNTQTIFSIRNSVTNSISLRVDYILSQGTLNILINPISVTPQMNAYYVFNSTITSQISVSLGCWNRIIIEVVQAQPLEFGVGFSSARVWVNGTGISRVYFGNFSNEDTPIADGNNTVLDLCGVYDSTNTNLVDPTLSGYFDIMNFLWFQGAEGLYPKSSASGCLWQGFIQPSQTSCLFCATGYSMEGDQKCVSSGSPNSAYFFNHPTNSYQKCFYGQYYNLSNGACSPCTADGQLISPPQCVSCDATCKTCNGTQPNQCTACYPNILLSSGSCLASSCPSLGFYLNTIDSRCYACTQICASCTGPTQNNCTSCNTGLYLTGNTCVPTCSQGTFANTQSRICQICDTSCQACTSATNMSCLSCNTTGKTPYFYNSACHSSCPDGTYPNSQLSNCLSCDTSCATCSAASNTSCLSCSSASYFTPFNGTCTSQCFSPYTPNVQTRSCDIQSNDAQTLNSTLEAIINSAFSSSSNMSLESKGGLLSNLSTTIANFESSNYGTDSSDSSNCTTCSGNGVCEYNPLYLMSLCQCNSGWSGDSCSISQADSASLEALTTAIINQISQVSLRLTISAVWSQSYLQALLSLINPSYSTLSDVQASLSLISGIITSDFNTKGPNDVFDPVKMTIATQIIDSCLSYVYKIDCYLQQNSSQAIVNTSIQALSELAALQLWQKQPDSGSYILDSTNLEVFSERVYTSELNGFQITPPNGPQVVLQAKNSTSGGSSSSGSTNETDIEIIFWKSDLLVCPEILKQDNTPPLVTMSLNNPDSLTASSQENQLSALILYPITSSAAQSYSNCSQGCTPTTKTLNGTKYFECECDQISSLSGSSEVQGFFAKSNLYKLAMAAALATFDYLHSWAFWILWVLTAWLILTIIAIKLRIVRPLSFRVHYNIPVERRPGRIENPKFGFFKTIFYALKYGHVLTSIYLYEDGSFPRLARVVLLYSRILTLMAFSCLFSKLSSGGDAFIVMLLSLGTVTPINAVLKLLLVTKIRSTKMINAITTHNPQIRQQELDKRKKLKKRAKIKKIIGYIFVISASAGCVYIILVVAANSLPTDSQRWAINFLISLAQDLGVSQIIKMLLTVIFIPKMAKTKSKRWKKIFKILIDPITARAIAMRAIHR